MKNRQKVYSKLLERDGGTCQYCNLPLECFDHIHIDHVIPRCDGADDDIDNLRLTCSYCNLDKGEKWLDEWKSKIKKRISVKELELSIDKARLERINLLWPENV